LKTRNSGWPTLLASVLLRVLNWVNSALQIQVSCKVHNHLLTTSSGGLYETDLDGFPNAALTGALGVGLLLTSAPEVVEGPFGSLFFMTIDLPTLALASCADRVI